jgi:hypothetical protein
MALGPPEPAFSQTIGMEDLAAGHGLAASDLGRHPKLRRQLQRGSAEAIVQRGLEQNRAAFQEAFDCHITFDRRLAGHALLDRPGREGGGDVRPVGLAQPGRIGVSGRQEVEIRIEPLADDGGAGRVGGPSTLTQDGPACPALPGRRLGLICSAPITPCRR